MQNTPRGATSQKFQAWERPRNLRKLKLRDVAERPSFDNVCIVCWCYCKCPSLCQNNITVNTRQESICPFWEHKGLWTLSVHMLPMWKLKMSVLNISADVCGFCDVYKSITITSCWLTSHCVNCHVWAVLCIYCCIPRNSLVRGRLRATRISWTVGRSNHVSGSIWTRRDFHLINNLL